jgi:hypothetical protein
VSCYHSRKGRVTNQPNGYDPSEAHSSEAVCDRDECIRKAISRVAALTNMTAVYVPDKPTAPVVEQLTMEMPS